MKNSKKLVGGLIAGAALGIAIGILMAPTSGQKTRKKIVGSSLKFKDDVMLRLEDSIESLRRQFNHKINQLARGGKDAVNTASEVVNQAGDKIKA